VLEGDDVRWQRVLDGEDVRGRGCYRWERRLEGEDVRWGGCKEVTLDEGGC